MYAVLTEHADADGRADLDAHLDALDAPTGRRRRARILAAAAAVGGEVT